LVTEGPAGGGGAGWGLAVVCMRNGPPLSKPARAYAVYTRGVKFIWNSDIFSTLRPRVPPRGVVLELFSPFEPIGEFSRHEYLKKRRKQY
jgi:hypothetical protein